MFFLNVEEDGIDWKSNVEEPVKFALVGISGIAVNFLILTVFIFVFHSPDEVAVAMGIIFSLTSNYFLNRLWTFKSSNPVIAEYFRYAIANSVGFTLQYITTILLENYFEKVAWTTINLVFIIPSIYVANIVGIGLGFLANFIFSKYFVFDF